MAATGFGVNTEAIARCVNLNQKNNNPDVIIYYDAKNAKAAFEHMETLTSSGLICEMSGFDSIEETRNYAKIRGISRIDIVSVEKNSVSIQSEYLQ